MKLAPIILILCGIFLTQNVFAKKFVFQPGEKFNPATLKQRQKQFCEAKTVGIVPFQLPIIYIYDGDTIKSSMTLPAPLDKISVRLRHIDTPETTWRAKCPKEKEHGLAATAFLKEFVGNTSIMTVTNYKWDKYGGRIDGDVEINGKDIATLLITNGFAVTYEGKGPKQDWCR